MDYFTEQTLRNALAMSGIGGAMGLTASFLSNFRKKRRHDGASAIWNDPSIAIPLKLPLAKHKKETLDGNMKVSFFDISSNLFSLPLYTAALGGSAVAGFHAGRAFNKKIDKYINKSRLNAAKAKFERELLRQQEAMGKMAALGLEYVVPALATAGGAYGAYKILQMLYGANRALTSGEEYDKLLRKDREREDRAQRAYAKDFRSVAPVRVQF